MTLTQRLGYAGLIPFVCAAGAALWGLDLALETFLSYSMLILCFMAGSCWGVVQSRGLAADERFALVAIVVFLWGWGQSFLPVVASLPGLMAGFIVLWLMERASLFKSVYSKSYRRLRTLLTLVVVGCHAVLIWWLFFTA